MTIRDQKAFTLIELLVVISIIGLLSSVVLSSVNSARAKSRDAQRKLIARQVQNALELYKFDNGGSYPLSGDASNCSTINISWSTSMQSACWNLLGTLLAPYLAKMPHDPLETPDGVSPANNGGPQTAGKYGFAYFSSAASWGCKAGQFYILMYRLESGATNIPTGCNGAAVQNYGIYETGSF